MALGLKIFSPIAGKDDSRKTHNEKRYLEKMDSKGLLLGTYLNNKIVGYVLAYEKENGILHISLLGVLPQNRGAGIGSKLLRGIEKRAKDLGYKKMSANTFTPVFEQMYDLLKKNEYRVVNREPTTFGEERTPAVKYNFIKSF